MYSVADRFDISESSVVLCMQKVLNFLQVVSAEEICWPSAANTAHIEMACVSKSGGKGPRSTVRCIDGHHRFSYVLIGFPGSAHDAPGC